MSPILGVCHNLVYMYNCIDFTHTLYFLSMSYRDLAQVDPLGPFVPQHKWNLSHGSSSSEELGMLNIEGEDTTLQHVPIEDWGCSLTEDISYLK